MKKILILENNNSIRNMVSDLPVNEEFKIIIIESFPVKAGLPAQLPDLIIADLTSIKKEKVELLMNLKNNPVISLVPFLLIISNNGNGKADHISVHNYYLNKPFTKETLYLMLKRILNHSGSISHGRIKYKEK